MEMGSNQSGWSVLGAEKMGEDTMGEGKGQVLLSGSVGS